MTHICLTALLKDAIDYLDYNKTFRNEDDYFEAVSYLINEFPAMKLEEWKIICLNLKAGKYGKMYERLKLPELVEIFQTFEGQRADMMKKIHDQQKEDIQAPSIDIDLLKKVADDLKLPEPKDHRGRWEYIVYPNSKEEN